MIGRIWDALLRAGTLRMWAMLGAGVALTGVQMWLSWIVWKGGWAATRQEQQLWYLGTALLTNSALIGVIVVALAAIKARGVLPGGVTFDIDGHDQDAAAAPPPTSQKITTTVETK